MTLKFCLVPKPCEKRCCSVAVEFGDRGPFGEKTMETECKRAIYQLLEASKETDNTDLEAEKTAETKQCF